MSKSNDRRRFLKNNTAGAISMSNRQIINDFKFIGRRYSCLADINANLNRCYSFQVCCNKIFNFICVRDNNCPVDLTLWKLQMMFRTGSCFISCVTYFYSLYRHIVKQDKKFEFSVFLHGQWLILYLMGTLTTIHLAAQVTSEVCTDLICS